jgi:NAD(P)-dependent dehydrogenase (short-subunit alcohol dehydrogenase family)
MDVQDTGILITGASRGLGAALARALAKEGAKLVLMARHEAPLTALVDEIRAEGGTAHALSADVADKQAVYRIAGAAAALVGPIDIVIHNASTLGPVPLQPLMDTDCEDVERTLAVNVVGPFRLSKALLGAMAVRGRGAVVNISSDASVNAYPTWGAYGISKAALDHMTRIWAQELDGAGVRFVAVDPGEMNTRMHADAVPDADPASLRDPATVAARIVSLLRGIESVASGSRVEVMAS